MTTLGEEEFLNFLVGCWEKSPTHKIKVGEKARQIKATSPDGKLFQVSSLAECLDCYKWNSQSYAENEQQLSSLSNALRSAVGNGDEAELEAAFRGVYSWGKVPLSNISGAMLNKWYGSQQLTKNLIDCLEIIETGFDLERFDGTDLFMNSGFTKVVSLASDPKKPLIIYDGRVGAALGHLAVLAIKESGKQNLHPNLLFPWGAARMPGVNRNPSNGSVKFPNLFSGSAKSKHFRHAKAMHIASKIINNAASKLPVSSRQLEASLFMWGYAVS